MLRYFKKIPIPTVLLSLLTSSCANLLPSDLKYHHYCSSIASAYQAASSQKTDNIDELYDNVLKNLALNLSAPPELMGEVSKQMNLNRTPAMQKHWNYENYKDMQQCLSQDRKLAPDESAQLKEYSDRILNYYLPEETELFKRRAGGKRLCSKQLVGFAFPYLSEKPRESCIYAHLNAPLIAIQSTQQGILVRTPGPDTTNLYFYKNNTTDDAVVDGGMIEPGYFSYEGIYSYRSLLGERSVYSFKRVEGNLMDNILFYQFVVN